ncbi:MAG: TadE family type IV pilus minor pilin [Allobranchiibius sp.]
MSGPRAGRRHRTHGDAGMVSAELAVGLPAVVFVLLVALGALTAGVDQVRCADAARVASRSAARGDTPSVVREQGLRAAPAGSGIGVEEDGDLIRVTVTCPVRGPFGWVVGSASLHSTGVAQRETAPTTLP